jgi:hypothetical protein
MHMHAKSFRFTKVGVNFKDILQYFKIVHEQIIPNLPYENFSLSKQNFENYIFRIFETSKSYISKTSNMLTQNVVS